jgi:hypothetical protein
MRTKMTNTQKILKALKAGPMKQADLLRETRVKNAYQIIADLKKKGVVFMDSGKYVNLHTPKETALINTKPSEVPKPESVTINTLKGEVENIQDGIRSLMMARSYLLRRIEEERNSREPSDD